ncbi:Fur family transcriptional regulator [Amedibacillus sp. YH-ame6]
MIRKSSKQRDMIMDYMRGIDGHVTPEQVYQDLNKDGSSISLATVYRNLNILSEMNEIKKIAHPIEGYQYDKTCMPHYHLHCTKCDKILDLNIPYDESLNEMITKKTGLQVNTHTMMVEGICEDCTRKQS